MKQLASTYIFCAIVSLSVLSLFFVFMRMPAQKAGLFEQRASRAFYDSQDSRNDEAQRLRDAEIAKKYFIQALRNNPYDAALWIRLASVQKTLGENTQSGNDTLADAVRIAKQLRPDIRQNLDRIIIQMNENNYSGGENE